MKKSQLIRSRMLFPWRYACVALVCHTAPIVYAASDEDLSALRDEVSAIRQSYEDRIAKLEARISEMEQEKKADQQTLEKVEKQAAAASSVAATNSAAIRNVKAAPAPPTPSEELPDASVEKIRKEMDAYDVTRGFTFSGYFRSGLGTDASGNTMEAFRAPNAQSKFRLGNEAETYVETAFGYSFPNLDLPEGVEFSVKFMPSYSVPNANAAKSTFSWRQAYAQAKGVWAGQPKASFWAGERFYNRYDVHMSDFYYLDMSGFGGGVENIELGDLAKLSVAWIGGSIDRLDSTGSEAVTRLGGKNSLDIRIHDIEVPGGKGMLWLDIADVKDSVRPNGANVEVKGNTGFAIGLLHEADDVFGGTNRAMVQFGVGAASNFRSTEPDYSGIAPADTEPPLLVDYNDVHHFRFVNDLVMKPSDQWNLSSTLVYDYYDASLEERGEVNWVSFGVRPVYFFNDFFSLAIEAGVDHTNETGGDSGEVYKFTIAPQIAPGRDMFSRPSIRFFMTYAAWSDDFIGKVSSQNYGNDSQGLNIGVQAEAWW
ncbi:maltoporin [Rubritalea marina]|uniref:maltoporin n=1 Tax=Rubritalea marina TaxID=361055 RepID=UPI0003A23D57|nr:carbohydrate porin [Rubritalea marina]